MKPELTKVHIVSWYLFLVLTSVFVTWFVMQKPNKPNQPTQVEYSEVPEYDIL